MAVFVDSKLILYFSALLLTRYQTSYFMINFSLLSLKISGCCFVLSIASVVMIEYNDARDRKRKCCWCTQDL